MLEGMNSRLAIIKDLREITRQVIAFVSGGKDSIANLLLLRDHGFEVYPIFLYVVPNVRFQNDYHAMLERKLGIEIHRMVHPAATLDMEMGRFMTPVKGMKELKFVEVESAARAMSGFEWITGGEKKLDSLQRRGMLSECGGINHSRRRAFPLSEWNDSDVYAYMKRARLSVPAEYAMFGASWGGSMRPAYLWQIAHHYPEDFEEIKKVYPLAETAVIRHQQLLDRGEA